MEFDCEVAGACSAKVETRYFCELLSSGRTRRSVSGIVPCSPNSLWSVEVSSGPRVSEMSIVTSTDRPIRSGLSGGSGWSSTILTGMRCTTLTQLPVAFSGGSNAKAEPVPMLMEST